MSDETSNGKSGCNQETTVLHLGKLVSEAAASTPADESMTAFIAKAAAETVGESAKPVVVPAEAGQVPPESMLGAVSYCYLKGVYGSNHIGKKMNQDTVFRESCQNVVPHPEDIRRFRRLNREAIQATLEKALRYARKKVAETISPSNPFRENNAPAVPEPGKIVPLEGRGEETQAFVKREASEHINKATFIDGMSM